MSRGSALTAGCFLACMHAVAWANHPVELEGIDVTAERERALTMPGVDEAREEINKTAGGVDVVEDSEYRDGRVSTLQDALGYSPGVFVQPRFGSEEARLSIRGSGLQRTFHLRGIELLQDGVPVNQADGGGDFQAIELAIGCFTVLRRQGPVSSDLPGARSR